MTTDNWTTVLSAAEESVRLAAEEVARLRDAHDAEIVAARDRVHAEAERAAGRRETEPEADAKTAQEGRAAARARVAAHPRRYGVEDPNKAAPTMTKAANDPEVKATTAADGVAEAQRRAAHR